MWYSSPYIQQWTTAFLFHQYISLSPILPWFTTFTVYLSLFYISIPFPFIISLFYLLYSSRRLFFSYFLGIPNTKMIYDISSSSTSAFESISLPPASRFFLLSSTHIWSSVAKSSPFITHPLFAAPLALIKTHPPHQLRINLEESIDSDSMKTMQLHLFLIHLKYQTFLKLHFQMYISIRLSSFVHSMMKLI